MTLPSEASPPAFSRSGASAFYQAYTSPRQVTLTFNPTFPLKLACKTLTNSRSDAESQPWRTDSPRDIGGETAADWRLRCTLHQKVVRNGGKSAVNRSGELASADATDASSKTAEMRSVCRTEAAFRAAQFRAQYTPTAEVLA